MDDRAGRLVRPYTVSNGRTRPSSELGLMTLVMATGSRPKNYLGPDHAQVLELCGGPMSVAELSAHVRLPAVVTKVLLSDLVDCGAVTTREPRTAAAVRTDKDVLKAVLHGLRKRL
ncbi:DUF742 domain-containing protein [Streptomyces zingiberis]|uniref:DUF742 domain-containing protein n=1 Tax=Streptomyces zingiberis TaxID=2053010 RepID=A0ABX1C218_9ACTN|nr:DUF742 domain-containing protein [Streptomyces zingiberis]NJQ02643.1 DUF742 domain-containing protein [Streptomyces zingiberis]